MGELYQGIKDSIDFRQNARAGYESRVASRDAVLDIGGRNSQSDSAKRILKLSRNPSTKITSTDIIAAYNPDIVDDICNSQIESSTYEQLQLA